LQNFSKKIYKISSFIYNSYFKIQLNSHNRHHLILLQKFLSTNHRHSLHPAVVVDVVDLRTSPFVVVVVGGGGGALFVWEVARLFKKGALLY